MPFGENGFYDLRILLCVFTDEKECGFRVESLQQFEDLRRDLGMRPIIERHVDRIPIIRQIKDQVFCQRLNDGWSMLEVHDDYLTYKSEIFYTFAVLFRGCPIV